MWPYFPSFFLERERKKMKGAWGPKIHSWVMWHGRIIQPESLLCFRGPRKRRRKNSKWGDFGRERNYNVWSFCTSIVLRLSAFFFFVDKLYNKQGFTLKNWVEGLSDETCYPGPGSHQNFFWLKSVNSTSAT